MSVRPYVCPHGTTQLPLDGFFMTFDIQAFFFLANVFRKFQFRLNGTRITGTLREDICTFVIVSH